MSIKSIGAKVFAEIIAKRINTWASNPIKTQKKVFDKLILEAKDTSFGKDHAFSPISSFDRFAKQVPIRDYEELKGYIDRVVQGEANVLWPGKPLYIAKTSGTTSGAKHIPLTKASMPSHIEAARNSILCYINDTGRADFVDCKMIFLQVSPGIIQTN